MSLAGAIAVAGAGIKTVSTIRNFNLARSEGDQADKIGKFNQAIENNRGLEALRARSREAQRLKDRVKRIRSSNIASGAPLEILAENAATAAVDQFNIRQQGIVENRAAVTRGNLERFKGRSAKKASRAKANSILIDFAGEAASTAGSLGLGGLGGGG